MPPVCKNVNGFQVLAYPGDNKTLLAFNFLDPSLAKDLAGFTIACQLPGADPPFYLFNFLQFKKPSDHAQDTGQLPHATINAPIQKYRWVDFAHAPKTGGDLVAGDYQYTVTPRYFDGNERMLKIDASKSVSLSVPVAPFRSGALSLGFTRGYMQSQAYARRYGAKTPIQPKDRELQYDTSMVAGKNADNKEVTYEQIYQWMGETARVETLKVIDEVLNDETLHLDVFAYDLNDTCVVARVLKLAAQGRIRIILDSARLHITHDEKNKRTGKVTTVVPLEDEFEKEWGRRQRRLAI